MREYSSEFMETWYHNPDEFDRLGGIWPLRVGRNIAKPNYQSGPRQIDYHSIHFVRKGRVELLYGKQEIILNKGDLFCLFPNVSYVYRVVPSPDTLELMWLAFDGNQAGPMLALAGLSEQKPYLQGAIGKDLDILLQQMLQIMSVRGTKYVLTLNGLMYRMFAGLAPEQEPETLRTEAGGWIRQSLTFMNAHYAEQITVADVARHIGIDRSHFSRMFTQTVGMPPVKYLQKLRMDRGSDLLRSTSLSITEIALTIGYPDLYSFTRAFRNQFGIPPRKFRE